MFAKYFRAKLPSITFYSSSYAYITIFFRADLFNQPGKDLPSLNAIWVRFENILASTYFRTFRLFVQRLGYLFVIQNNNLTPSFSLQINNLYPKRFFLRPVFELMALITFLKNNFLCKHPPGFDNIVLELVNIANGNKDVIFLSSLLIFSLRNHRKCKCKNSLHLLYEFYMFYTLYYSITLCR